MDAERVSLALLAAWNARDIDSFIGLLAEDIEWYDPAMVQPPARGRAAVRDFTAAILEAFPDFRYEVQPPLCVSADGTRCAIVWKITATHTKPLIPPGYAPTGRTAAFDGVDVLDVRDGKVVRIRTSFDAIAAGEQLLGFALRPKPGSFREAVAVGIQRVLAAFARRR